MGFREQFHRGWGRRGRVGSYHITLGAWKSHGYGAARDMLLAMTAELTVLI
jgi:hypothetical protein